LVHVPLLDELALVAALAVLVTLLLARLRLPTVAGLLLAGAIAGPYGLGLVRSVEAIEVLAEVGVVLLLFTIGLEFSLSRLRDVFAQVAIGGLLQVGLTTAAVAGIAGALGAAPGTSIFYGFVFALSSTAIVLRGLTERRELDAPHGRFIVGTLIFQDLCVVPMVLVVPLLAGPPSAAGAFATVGLAMVKAVLVVAATLVIARLVVPRVFAWVDASRSREVFLLAVLAMCIGTAWLTSLAGLSLALGAFLGGLVVADTEYGHRALGDILPLRDAFVSVFFISLGMLFDVQVVASQPGAVILLFLGFLVFKGLLATVAALAMRFPARVAWLAGVGLAQFGEFGFVLAKLGQGAGVVTPEAMRPLLAAGVASMFVAPMLMRIAPHVTAGERLLAPLERLIGVRSIDEADEKEPLEGHVVVVGYGLGGRIATGALSSVGTEFVVLELNAETVRGAKKAGLPVFYGDATSAEALEHACLRKARALLLLMNDPLATQRVVATAQRIAPRVPIMVRTHYLAENARISELGASDVVAEEVEGAIEVVSRLLRRLEVPRNAIDSELHRVRSATGGSDRPLTVPRASLGEQRALDDLKVESVVLGPDAHGIGRSVVALRLRSTTGALVVAVRRGDRLLERPDPTDPFQNGDVVYLVGTLDAVERAVAALTAPHEPDDVST
jgi:CPA2 family monovalent cation:H+ antiporter-2